MKKIFFLFAILATCGCASVKQAQTPMYRARLDVETPGLGTAKVIDSDKKTVKELFKGKSIHPGILDVAWDGTDADGKVVPEARYQAVLSVLGLKMETVGQFGGLGSSQGRFVDPKGISAAYQGARITVAVADTGNNRIELFTDSGSFLQEIGRFGLGDQMLNQPTDVDWDGQILTVCDSQNRRLARFDSTGASLGQVSQLTGFPTSSSNPIHLDFQNPTNLQREGGSFWVSDPGYGLIELLTNTGGLIQQLGQNVPLSNDGPFLKWPTGDVWFKSGKDRVVRIDSNGNELGELKGDSAFQSVAGMALSSKGFAVISDPTQGLLCLFDQEGKCFETIPTPECRQPGALAILDDDLFIIDQDQNSVFHYKLVESDIESKGPFFLEKSKATTNP